MTSTNQLHYHFWGPEAFWWGGFPKLCQPQIRMWQLPSLRMPSVWSGLLKDHRKSACFKEIPMKQWIWNWMIPNAKSILDLHLAHLRHDRMVAKHLVSCVSEWGEPATPRPQILVGNHPFWSFGCPNVWDIFKSSMEKNLDIEPWFSLTLSLSSSRVDLPRENRRDKVSYGGSRKKICHGRTFAQDQPFQRKNLFILHIVCAYWKNYIQKNLFFSTPYISKQVYLNELSSFSRYNKIWRLEAVFVSRGKSRESSPKYPEKPDVLCLPSPRRSPWADASHVVNLSNGTDNVV